MTGTGNVGSRVAKTVVRYGVKYGPLVFQAVKHGREPAQRAVQRALARQTERRKAEQHAATLVEGTVLKVFRDGEPVWVVFSGDAPVVSYPGVEAPLPTLLEHADLSRRVKPGSSNPMKGLRRKLPLPASPAALPRLARKALRRWRKP